MSGSDRSLRSIVINKEVVLLRQAVRKSRVYVVSKLTREAKKLRNKRGDEKQVEKNKRKAEKLGREVTSLKTVKDDEISRFGITNLEKLQEISQDPSTPDLTRVIAKVANHKSFVQKLTEFREKFPDYGEYISSKKKQAKSKEKKSTKEASKPKETERVPTVQPIEDSHENSDSLDDSNGAEDEEENNNDAKSDVSTDETDQKTEKISTPTPTKSKPEKSKASKATKPQANSTSNTSVTADKPKKAPTDNETTEEKPVKVISKVATVKRFTEMLQEENENSEASDPEEDNTEKETIEVKKEVDDFFMSADNNGAHFVIAATPLTENTDDNWEDRTKNRYFGTNPQRKPRERSFGNNNWENGPKRKGKWNDTDRIPQRAGFDDRRRKNVEPERKKLRRNEESGAPKEAEHLHPSWEAKRKQQEILKQGFQGKKIVFGDD